MPFKIHNEQSNLISFKIHAKYNLPVLHPKRKESREKICRAMCLASTLLLRVTPHDCSGQDISFCLHTNQSLKYASSPQEERNFIYGMSSRSHREEPYSVHPRNIVRYQCSTKAYVSHIYHIYLHLCVTSCLI